MAELGCIFNNNKIKHIMKKVLAIVAIAALAACGSNNTVAVNADSTATTVDSTAVVADSTTTVADSTTTK